MLAFAEWMPDTPDLGGNATEALNCYPRTAGSYGPFGTPVEYSTALSGRCQGAFTAKKNEDGVAYNFAGDASKLYLLASQTFNDISKTGGYAVGTEERWEFQQFGNLVLANAWNNPIQQYDLSSTPATFTDLSADAPQARRSGIIRDFYMVGNTYDAVFGFIPNRVWWPALNDPTNWPTPGTQAAANVQSDYQDLAEGGAVQAIVGAVGGADGAIVCETSIYRVQYEGSPIVFRFDHVEKERGTPAPGSVVSNGNIFAFLSDDGFYIFDGANSTPIGASKVDKWFYERVDQTFMNRITSVCDPINKLLIWSFPDGQAGGTPNNLLIWNWQLNRWSHAQLSVEYLIRARTVGYTLEGLDAIAPSGSLDLLPYSLDSRLYAGGALSLGSFTGNNKLAFLTGPALAASITTGETDGSGIRLFARAARPLVDGSAPTVKIGYRDDQAAVVNWTNPTGKGVDGCCPQRIDARYLRAQVDIPAGGGWSHAMGIDPVYRQGGKR